MNNLSFAQARSIIFKREHFAGGVHLEPAKTVGVGELPEAAELRFREGRLQFVGNFHESHGESIAGQANVAAARRFDKMAGALV